MVLRDTFEGSAAAKHKTAITRRKNKE